MFTRKQMLIMEIIGLLSVSIGSVAVVFGYAVGYFLFGLGLTPLFLSFFEKEPEQKKEPEYNSGKFLTGRDESGAIQTIVAPLETFPEAELGDRYIFHSKKNDWETVGVFEVIGIGEKRVHLQKIADVGATPLNLSTDLGAGGGVNKAKMVIKDYIELYKPLQKYEYVTPEMWDEIEKRAFWFVGNCGYGGLEALDLAVSERRHIWAHKKHLDDEDDTKQYKSKTGQWTVDEDKDDV